MVALALSASFVTPSATIHDLTDEQGRLRLLPASAYDAIPRQNLQGWCHHNARYGLPTVELVAWIKEQIGGRKAIEVGSGAGDLGYHLGIPATDNRCQEKPDVRAYYEALGQPVIRYPDWVERLDAQEAIRVYEPEVVVGSWLTQWISPNKRAPKAGGNMYGVKEAGILNTGVTYIMVGNHHTHGGKKILRFPHEEHALPFIRSRTSYPELERVYIWRGR